MRSRLAAVACVLLLTPVGAALEDDAAEDAVRELHREARAAKDLWTCLQLEAWSDRELRRRLGPAVRGCIPVGEPLFAFPENVRAHWDRGGEVDVLAGRAHFRLAGDGRPLRTLIKTVFDPHHATEDYGGRHLVYARIWGAHNRRRFSLAVQDAATGEVTGRWIDQYLRPTAEDNRDYLVHAARCSWDGGTAAIGVHRGGGPDTKRIVVLCGEERWTVRDAERLHGVGRENCWLLYRKDSDGAHYLRCEDEQRVFSWAAGPGLWLLETGQDERIEFLEEDGTLTPFRPSVALGRNAAVETCGRYLVVRSGHGATGEPKRDMLGNLVEGGTEQPHTLAIYRWSELAADRAAPPVLELEQDWDPANAHGPALLLREGSRVQILDLAGPEPVRSELVDLGQAIADVGNDHHYYRARLADETQVVFDAAGVELWRGTTGWLDVGSRGVLIHRPEGWNVGPIHVVRLDPDPAKRKEIVVGLDTSEGWGVNCDRLNRLLVVHRSGDWRRLDPETGKVVESYDISERDVREGRVRRPPRGDVNRNSGMNRFYRRGGRLLDKRGVWRTEPARCLRPENVFQTRTALVILDRDREVHVSTRGRIETIAEGVRADGFGFLKGQRGLFLTRGRRQRSIVGALAGGPSLRTDIPQREQRAEDFESGRWHERGLSYSVPGFARMRWERDQYGYEPHRLVSYQHTDLFMVFESLILQMDPAAARAVGVKDG